MTANKSLQATIDLSFRYDKRDCVRAFRAHFASSSRLRLAIVPIMFLFFLGAYLWRSENRHWLGVVSIAFAVAFGLLLVALAAAFTIIPLIAFRLDPRFHDDYSLTFSAEGIHSRTAQIDSQLQWSIYSRALIDAYSYLLYRGKHQFTIIPKRVFQSAEQQQAFEQLLTQRISQIVRRDA